jgi:murein DD-endopeptidase MepM/ murein hydrolase activator NlpD
MARMALRWIVPASTLVTAIACTEPPPPPCGGYPAQERSEYVLPWPVGQEFSVLTGNCRNDVPTHSNHRRYAYDFRMPSGSPVAAARSGTVARVVENYSDLDHTFNHENFVAIAHGDGTFAYYFHLAQNGVLVDLGDSVERGQVFAILGTSGSIGPAAIPHLHFEVTAYLDLLQSMPVTFRNTRPHPNGLVDGETYRAEVY